MPFKILFCALSTLLVLSEGLAQTVYYVDPNGSDSNSGTSTSSPWRTVAKVNQISFRSGDQVLFRRGGRWAEELSPSSSGSSGSPITFGAYGSGSRPLFSALEEVPGWKSGGNWSDIGGNRWRFTGSVPRDPIRMLFDGVEYGTAQTVAADNPVGSTWRWYWESGQLTVYASSNPATFYGSIVLCNGNGRIGLRSTGRSWLVFRSLDFEGGAPCVEVSNVDNTVWDSCSISRWSGGGMSMRGGSDNCTIQYCTLDRADVIIYPWQTKYVGGGDNLLMDAANGNEIKYSQFFNNRHDAININAVPGSTVNNNSVHHCEFRNANDYGRALDIHGVTPGVESNNEFHHNYIHHMSMGIQFGGDHNKFYYNVVDTVNTPPYWSSTSGRNIGSFGIYFLANGDPRICQYNQVYNNTFANTQGVGATFSNNNGCIGNELYNNIFYNCGLDAAGNPDLYGVAIWITDANTGWQRLENNLMYHPTQTNTILYRIFYDRAKHDVAWFNGQNGSNGDILNNNIAANPLLLPDHRIQSGSPARDVGASAGSSVDFWGDAVPYNGRPDIGVHEWRPTGGTLLLPPRLLSPADGSVGLASTVRVQWARSSGANSYQLQISTRSDFATTLVDRASISDTVQDAGSLPASTTLYWRVRSSNGSTVSDYSSAWSFSTLGVPALLPPRLLSPSDGSVGLASTVRVQWARSSGANAYQLQVSTRSDFATTLVDRAAIVDTVLDAASLPAGTKLYWRVRSSNGSTVSNYSSAWSFSTLGASVLLPPKLLSPPDGSAGLASAVRVQWARSSGAASYQLQISTGTDFGTTLVDRVSVSDTAQDAGSLPAGTKLYWRVRSNNGATVSDYSSAWSFSIRPETVATEPGDIAKLGTAVALVASPKGSGNKSLEILRDGVMPPAGSSDPAYQYDTWDGTLKSFDWIGYTFPQVHRMNRVKFQEGIRLVTSGGWFSDLRVQVRRNGTWVDVAGLSSAPLYPTTSGGSYGTYNLTFSPVIGDGIRIAGIPAGAATYISVAECRVYEVPMIPPTAPTILAPASGEVNTPTLVAVRWKKVDDASSYRFQLSVDSLFRTFFRNDSLLIDTVRVVGSLSGGTRYFVRVQASNSAGNSPFSTVSRFTTESEDAGKTTTPPATPTIVTPLAGSTVEPATVTLRWTKSSDAIFYHLQVAYDSLFQSLFVEDSAVTDTARPIGPLASMRSYFARVHAQNTGGVSPFSRYVKFQTAGETSTIPSAPLLAAPPDNAILPLAALRLVWNGGAGVSRYQVQVAREVQFLTMLLDTTVSATSLPMGALEPACKYYWRVRAVESAKLSDYSPVRAFAVGPVSSFLNQNYPNPFNPTTIISYNLEQQDFVDVKVFDILGREVATLVSEVQSAGAHHVSFDAASPGSRSGGLASGVYLCRMRAGTYVEIRKMLLKK